MSAPGGPSLVEALPKVERSPLLGGMLSGADSASDEAMQTVAAVNPLPLAAQLSRLEDAHRGGYSAAELESASSSSAAPPPPPPGVAAAGASATAPSSLLPPRARGALLESALAAVADEGFDDGTPRGRRACTASCLAPCATLNGNVATLYSCGAVGREPPRVWPWLCQWGPDWPCNIGTFALILCPTIAFQALVAWRISVGVTIAGLAVALFALVTLALTALSDPGYLPKQSKAQLEGQRRAMEEQGLTGTFTCCRA